MRVRKITMKYEILHNISVPKIGFGCWSIGGESTANPAEDERSLTALHSAIDLGYTHFDTAEYYAAGHSEELLGQAVRESGKPRDTFFITTKVSPEHLGYDDVLRSCAASLKRLGLESIDLYLIHWPARQMNLPETFRALNQLVREGRVRHLGVSNFNLKLLREAHALSETPLLTNQVPYSIPDRSYVENGVLAYCQANDILLTAYSPIKSRFFKGKKLAEFARARASTPFQIGLAWLVQQPRVIAIPTSFNPQHQAENLAALDLNLTAEEMAMLNGLA
jgi:diketogulonate reductase-like aldo/keto reductase